MHRGEQQSDFSRDAWPRFLLKHAFAQHLLDEYTVIDDGSTRLAGSAVKRRFALSLDDQLAVSLKAEVGDHGRGDLESFRSLAKPPQGTQLQLEFVARRHIGVRRLERAIGKRRPGPDCQKQHREKMRRRLHRESFNVPDHASTPSRIKLTSAPLF